MSDSGGVAGKSGPVLASLCAGFVVDEGAADAVFAMKFGNGVIEQDQVFEVYRVNIDTPALALGGSVGVLDHHKRRVVTLAQVHGELVFFLLCESVYKHEGSVDTVIVKSRVLCMTLDA